MSPKKGVLSARDLVRLRLLLSPSHQPYDRSENQVGPWCPTWATGTLRNQPSTLDELYGKKQALMCGEGEA